MNTVAIILAAGKGTRFGKCRTNKTAVMVNGRSLIQRGLDNISQLVDKVVIVVGFKKETVMESIQSTRGTLFVHQIKRLGTGHAVKVALEAIKDFPQKPEDVFVANGDHLFMIHLRTLSQLFAEHKDSGNDVTILSTINKHPENLNNGRIIRKNGRLISILEKCDFKKNSRSIQELNSGTYVFKYQPLVKALEKAKRERGSELFITKVIFEAGKVGALAVPFDQVGTGVNTRHELVEFTKQYSNHA